MPGTQQAQEKPLSLTNANQNYMRYHLTLVRRPLSKRTQITSIAKDVEKREPSYTIGRNVKYGKECGGFSKKQKYNDHMLQQFHSWVYIRRKKKH